LLRAVATVLHRACLLQLALPQRRQRRPLAIGQVSLLLPTWNFSAARSRAGSGSDGMWPISATFLRGRPGADRGIPPRNPREALDRGGICGIQYHKVLLSLCEQGD